MSQEELAFQAAVDRTSISYIENETVSASIDLFDRLAGALGVDVAEFLRKPQPDDKLPPPQTWPATKGLGTAFLLLLATGIVKGDQQPGKAPRIRAASWPRAARLSRGNVGAEHARHRAKAMSRVAATSSWTSINAALDASDRSTGTLERAAARQVGNQLADRASLEAGQRWSNIAEKSYENNTRLGLQSIETRIGSPPATAGPTRCPIARSIRP